MIATRASKTARAYDSIKWNELDEQLKAVSDARAAKSMVSNVVRPDEAGDSKLVVDRARALTATKVIDLAGRFRLKRATLEEVVRSVVDVEYERNAAENNPVWRKMVSASQGEDQFRFGLSLSLLSNENLVVSLARAAEDGVDPAELYRLSTTRVHLGGAGPVERERMRAAADVFDYFDTLRIVRNDSERGGADSDVMGWTKEDMNAVKKELGRGNIWPSVFALEEGMRWSAGRGDFPTMRMLNLLRLRLIYGNSSPTFTLEPALEAFGAELSAAERAAGHSQKAGLADELDRRVADLSGINNALAGGNAKPAIEYMDSSGRLGEKGMMLHDLGEQVLDSVRPQSTADTPEFRDKSVRAYEMWVKVYDALTKGERRYRP